MMVSRSGNDPGVNFSKDCSMLFSVPDRTFSDYSVSYVRSSALNLTEKKAR